MDRSGDFPRRSLMHWNGTYDINGVDFSPNSAHLVVASRNRTATIRDTSAGWRVINTLYHDDRVTAAKYSPRGDRIATATPRSVRVYNSLDGRLLIDIKANVIPWYNTGLLWFNDHLFLVSDNRIKQINASTGSAVSEWPAPDTKHSSCITLSQHGKFIAYSTDRTVVFWDLLTKNQLGIIQHAQNIRSIALSADQLIALAGEGGKVIKRLSRITASIVYY